MTLSETFDILTYKGVENDIQRIFASHASQDGNGQLRFNFFDGEGLIVDKEILSLHRNKKASHGISCSNFSENINSVFVSDSYASLIYFANQYKARISFGEAYFLVIGADFDLELLRKEFSKIPAKAKVNTVFSSTILGRVMDCKIQDLIQKRVCSYVLSDDLVQVKNLKKGKFSAESIVYYSLRTYCISQGIKQTVRTFKTRQKGIETFFQLNQLAWNGPK